MRQNFELTVSPAMAGGYVVYGSRWATQDGPPIIIAGSLEDCLGYVREQLKDFHRQGASDDAPAHAGRT